MNLKDIQLKENGDVVTGGLSHSTETLGEFMEDLRPNEKRTLNDVNSALLECGILPINEYNYKEVSEVKNFEFVARGLKRQ